MALTKKQKSELQKEVVDVLEYQPHGLLWLSPRCGKTKMIIDLIKRDKYRSILWVTPEKELAEKDIPKEFETWKAKRYIKRLTTSTYSSLNKVIGYFDIVILDEVQHLTENNVKNLSDRNIDYISIIGMTGTPTKHEDKQELYRDLKLKSLYKIDLNKAVNIGLLSDYQINVVTVEMDKENNVEAGNKTNRFLTSESKNYEYASLQIEKAIVSGASSNTIMFKIFNRMRMIKNSKSKLKVAQHLIRNLKGRKLIFAGSIKQAELLSKNTYHSKTDGENLRQFKAMEIDELALVNSGGTGHTYKKVDHLILVQADSDKNGLTSQKIARCLLAQKGFKASIWVVQLDNTKDADWISSTLTNFDSSKIKYVKFKDLKL